MHYLYLQSFFSYVFKLICKTTATDLDTFFFHSNSTHSKKKITKLKLNKIQTFHLNDANVSRLCLSLCRQRSVSAT